MKKPLQKYVIVASVITLLWLVFLVFSFMKFTSFSTVIADEVRANSRQIGEQVNEIFKWFEERQTVYVTSPENASRVLPTAAQNTTFGGQPLTMAVPIELAKKLENNFENGVSIRFVSNTPLDVANIPTAIDNQAMMAMASEGKSDFFEYLEQENMYHYVRPLFASKTCVTCHAVAMGDVVGSVVVDTNPREFILHNRAENQSLITILLYGSTVTILLFYFFVLRFWRKYQNQGANLEYSQSMVEGMSQGMEVIIGNVSRIINELAEGNFDPKKAELLRTLQYMNEDLRNTSRDLQFHDGSKEIIKEELIHVDTFFRQCVQIFHARSLEKGIDLLLRVDATVPVHVYGDAFHLRQLVNLLVKNAVQYTEKGGVVVRVRSAVDLPTRFSTKELEYTPIHLVIEVEDTSRGYVATDQQRILQKFAEKSKSTGFNAQPIIDIRPIKEMTKILNGSLTIPHNSKSGACFTAAAQVKMADEALLGRQGPSATQPQISPNTQNPHAQMMPAPVRVETLVQDTQESQGEAQSHGVKAQTATPQAGNSPQSTQSFQTTSKQMPSQSSSQNSAEQSQAEQRTPQIATATASPTSLETQLPEFQREVRVEASSIPEQAKAAEAVPEGPISIIIGDSGIEKFTSEMRAIFEQEEIVPTLMGTADEIFKALDNSKHGYSVVFLRELSDLDILYTATRLRYLERLGSKPVAIVIMAEDVVEADMDVLRFFNVSTVDNFPRDASIAVKVTRLALRTQGNKIFQGGKLLDKTKVEGDPTKFFDVEKALENSKKDKKLIQSVCAMWVRFYPEQLRRLRVVIKEGTQEDKLRILRAIKNSASTVSLPILWDEAHRLIEKLSQGQDVRFEKILSIFEQTHEHLTKYLESER